MTQKASLWIGTQTKEYDEVERQRAIASLASGQQAMDSDDTAKGKVNGEHDEIEGKIVEGFEEFGHNMVKYWGFDKDCELSRGTWRKRCGMSKADDYPLLDTNLNHGMFTINLPYLSLWWPRESESSNRRRIPDLSIPLVCTNPFLRQLRFTTQTRH